MDRINRVTQGVILIWVAVGILTRTCGSAADGIILIRWCEQTFLHGYLQYYVISVCSSGCVGGAGRGWCIPHDRNVSGACLPAILVVRLCD